MDRQEKVYDRLTDTPPAAQFSEPKRMLRGHNTRLEFNCSLYVDPKTGDVYSVNNDMVDHMVVFPRNAEGDVAPMRKLHTPHRTFGIAVDEEAQELFLTVQHPPQVVVYHKTAKDEDEPIRTLEGRRTQLEDAHGIAIDTKNNWMFVANHGNFIDPQAPGTGKFEPPSITVYPLKASGDTPPLRIIEGPRTQLNWPALLYFDQEREELYVANDQIRMYPPKGWIVATQPGRSDVEEPPGVFVGVWSIHDNGDVPARWKLGGPKSTLQKPRGVVLNPKHKEIIIADMRLNSVLTYYFPEIF